MSLGLGEQFILGFPIGASAAILARTVDEIIKTKLEGSPDLEQYLGWKLSLPVTVQFGDHIGSPEDLLQNVCIIGELGYDWCIKTTVFDRRKSEWNAGHENASTDRQLDFLDFLNRGTVLFATDFSNNTPTLLLDDLKRERILNYLLFFGATGGIGGSTATLGNVFYDRTVSPLGISRRRFLLTSVVGSATTLLFPSFSDASETMPSIDINKGSEIFNELLEVFLPSGKIRAYRDWAMMNNIRSLGSLTVDDIDNCHLFAGNLHHGMKSLFSDNLIDLEGERVMERYKDDLFEFLNVYRKHIDEFEQSFDYDELYINTVALFFRQFPPLTARVNYHAISQGLSAIHEDQDGIVQPSSFLIALPIIQNLIEQIQNNGEDVQQFNFNRQERGRLFSLLSAAIGRVFEHKITTDLTIEHFEGYMFRERKRFTNPDLGLDFEAGFPLPYHYRDRNTFIQCRNYLWTVSYRNGMVTKISKQNISSQIS